MNTTSLALTLVGFGLMMLLIGSRHLWKVHTWRPAAFNLICGVLALIAAAVLFVLSLNLSSYDTLRYQTPVAEISFTQLKNGQFNVRLMRIPSGSLQVFTVNGDEWRIGLRTLTFSGWPAWLGVQPKARLQEFSVRPAGEQDAARTVVLSGEPGPPLWDWAQAHPADEARMAAGVLESPFTPMADNARYRLLLTPTGVSAQAVNRSASSAADTSDTES